MPHTHDLANTTDATLVDRVDKMCRCEPEDYNGCIYDEIANALIAKDAEIEQLRAIEHRASSGCASS